MSEIVTINIGGAGIRIGNKIWQNYIKEHDIDQSGIKIKEEGIYDDQIIFKQTRTGKRTPLNIFVDMQSDQIDQIKRDRLRSLYHPGYSVVGQGQSGNFYTRGHYTAGRQAEKKFIHKLRHILQSCDRMQGIVLNCSLSEGGSGLTTLAMQRIFYEFQLKQKSLMANILTPSPSYSNCIVEPYNFVLAYSDLQTTWKKQVHAIYDNQQIYKLCETHFEVQNPGFNEVNQYIAKAVALYSNSWRVRNNRTFMNQLSTNTLPYQRAQCLTPYICHFDSLVPDVREVIGKLYDFSNSMSSYGTNRNSNIVTSSVLLRGQARHMQVLECINDMKRQVKYLQLAPTNTNLCISQKRVQKPALQGIVLHNNISGTCQLLRKIKQKCQIMYGPRYFMHWLSGEGLSGGYMQEAFYNLQNTINSYMEMNQHA